MTGRVIAQQWVSVDGLAAGADGDEMAVMRGVDDAADARSQEYNDGFLDAVDEVILGRRTYEQFVAYRPDAEERIAPRVNTIAKTVASTSLSAAPWGRHPSAAVTDDVVGHVRARRDEGATLVVWGSLDVAARLHEAGVVDELDLFVAPVLLGAGTPVLTTSAPVFLEQLANEDWGSVTHQRLGVRR